MVGIAITALTEDMLIMAPPCAVPSLFCCTICLAASCPHCIYVIVRIALPMKHVFVSLFAAAHDKIHSYKSECAK